MKRVIVMALAAMLLSAASAQASGGVVVNRVGLTTDEVRALEWYYGVPLKDGVYWYDRDSGLWGLEGGPWVGQIAPGLDLGGPLRSDASGGNTGVFFNGRQLHPTEVQYLRRVFGSVPTGRYWLGPDGVGGAEGGPASFSLNTQRVPDGGAIDRGAGGTWGSDGRCFYVSVDSGDVLGPGC